MNIYVGNISLELTENELRKEFLAFGQVKGVNMMNNTDIGSGQPWGYAFVEMASESDGDAAVNQLNGKTLKGREISVIKALPLSEKKEREDFDSRRSSRFNRARQRGLRRERRAA
jgi:RNA recognition motif-containing protein